MSLQSMRNIILTILSFSSLVLVSFPSVAGNYGALGLYNSANHKIANALVLKLAKQTGCEVIRVGEILKNQGNYPIKSVNNFFIVDCHKSIFANENLSHWTSGLNDQVNDLVLLEGDFGLVDRKSLSEKGLERSYILKLSQFNNTDPIQRNIDLMSNYSLVATLDNSYRTEAQINVSQAYGITRPDKVVVIYYETLEKAKKFRADNTNILQKISEFNQTHLNQFVYLFGRLGN